ncbi:unnamed protein product [Phyllotreta striolata]|uniref:Protein HEXIM1 n=1 Tax=Phyllotreta striolata TaxID=444603 RepID=A0A9N9TRE1_PHYSR|nr:unnamed protein product [Phyllotreta striolata]
MEEKENKADPTKHLQDDVASEDLRPAATGCACAAEPNATEAVPKKRKTRRGKSKRRHPYLKQHRKAAGKLKLVKPEAPHNSNQFLLEDHELIEELDRNFMSPSTLRTRDSSFSVDSEGDFYSSPDDEQKFLIKDFDDQYESLQAERLQSLSKVELIQEYIALENKLEQLTKQTTKLEEDSSEDSCPDLKQEVERLTIENERLRRENDLLRSKVNESDSEDSETDSSDSCSSSSSSSDSSSSKDSNRSRSPINNGDYSSGKMNGVVSKSEAVL